MESYTRDLKYGDTGDDVRALQLRLIEIGFGKCLVKGQVKTLTGTGNFFEITRECLESFQAKVLDAVLIAGDFVPAEIKEKYPFSIDGIMNYSDWYILINYNFLIAWYKIHIKPDDLVPDPEPEQTTVSKIIKKLLEIATGEVGVREKGTSNTGVRVNEYQNVGSCGQVKYGGNPWCSYYVKWLIRAVLKLFNIKDFLECGGYTPYDRQWGIKNGIAVKVKSIDDIDAGDIFLIYGSGRGDAVHTGLVKGKKNGRVITNEGNTNSAGSSDGGGVEDRLRPVSQIWYVIKWWKLLKV